MQDRPLYVYGIAREDSDTGAGAPGLDGSPLRTVVESDLAAFVSDAPPGDVATTRDRLLTHARVLEELSAERTVLPMRFGVVAPSERALRDDVLRPRRKLFAKLLDRLEGAVEIDVRILYDEVSLLRDVVRSTPAVRRLQLSVRNRPSDATYYDRIKLGEAVAGAIAARVERDAPKIAKRLESRAIDARRREPSHERMVLNEAFLVKRSAVPRFEEAVGDLEDGGQLLVRMTGPMPPYSFVDLQVEPAGRRRRSWAS